MKSTVSGDFRITESLGRPDRWLPWIHKQSYYLKIVDPMIIEITEGKVRTHFFKCSAKSDEVASYIPRGAMPSITTFLSHGYGRVVRPPHREADYSRLAMMAGGTTKESPAPH